jgi:hypothetical protein
MKKWILRIGIAVVVLIILAVVVVSVFLNDIVKKGVETVGPQLTKTEVRLASSRISPLSGNGQITKLFIGNPEGFKTESAIKIGDMKVALDVGSLFSDMVIVEKIAIESPEITFEGGLSGNNLSKILDNLESASTGEKEPDAEEQAGQPKKHFRAKEVVITGGKIHVSVTGLGGKSATVPLQDIHLQNIGSDMDGATLAELAKEVLQPMVTAAIKGAGEAIMTLEKDVTKIGKDAIESTEKAAKGIKDLFKKK